MTSENRPVSPPKRISFARRVRELLEQRKLMLAELAERAELPPSVVSKLLTDTDASRREPRLEHILGIARALELQPRELVIGTDAEGILGDWVPRTEFEAESTARGLAQTQAATLRTELAGTRQEAQALQESVNRLTEELASVTHRLGDVEDAARRERTKLRVACEAAEAKCAAAVIERDNALARAHESEQAWTNLRSRVQQLQREVAAAKESGWLKAFLGAAGGLALGAAAAEPAAPIATARRRRKVRR